MKKIIPRNKSSGGSKNINIYDVLCSEARHGKKIANGFNNFFASAAVSGLSVVFLLEKEALIKKLMDQHQILNLNWQMSRWLSRHFKVSKQARLVVWTIYLCVC